MIHIHNSKIVQDAKSWAVEMFPSAVSASIVNVELNQGGLFKGHGGKLVEIHNVGSKGAPSPTHGMYFIYTGDSVTEKFRFDNSMRTDWIRQPTKKAGEAAIRLQQLDDAEIRGMRVQGNGYKQAVQVRPGGKTSARFGKIVLMDCIIKGLMDVGGFDDPSDVNYPFGKLDLLKLVRVNVSGIHITKCEKKHHRIKKIQCVDCIIGGKKFNGLLT